MNRRWRAAPEHSQCYATVAPVQLCRSKGVLLGWLSEYCKGLLMLLKAFYTMHYALEVCLELMHFNELRTTIACFLFYTHEINRFNVFFFRLTQALDSLFSVSL